MATTNLYQRLLQKLAATAAVGLLTATSQAGLFCDWKVDHKRPYCSPACDQAWGYHDTCWRQFPPTEPCTDWGAHCAAYASDGSMNYGAGVSPGLNAVGPYTGVPMVPQMQQPLMLQQQLGPQNFQQQGPSTMNSAPQGNWNSYNANPAPVPPSGRANNTRTYGPSVTNDLPAPGEAMQGGGMQEKSMQENGMEDGMEDDGSGGEQLQLPGLDGDAGEFQLPDIPDLSRATPYYNPGPAGQNYGNQYRPVSQGNATSQYGQPLLYPSNVTGNQQQYPQQQVQPQQQYGQPAYGQQQFSQQNYGAVQAMPAGQAYAQPMMPQHPQQQMMPSYLQQGNQYQAPQRSNYRPQQGSIQVAPGRQPSVVGVSFSRSIRPAGNAIDEQQPMPKQKKSFLSKINPFSK